MKSEETDDRIRVLESELALLRSTRGHSSAGVESSDTSLKHENTGRAPIEHPADHQSLQHHATENFNTYGHSDGVVFVEPKKEAECHPADERYQKALSAGGVYRILANLCIKYKVNRLVSRPSLHQWIQDGVLYREAIEHQASKFELFFDLLFVGIVHQISDAAAEEPNGDGLLKYFLTFSPAYSIWSDVRDIINQYGVDDVTQRAYILWIMLLLVGLSNNASSIEIGPSVEDDPGLRSTAIAWALGFATVAKLSKVLLLLVYSFFLCEARSAIFLTAINSALASLLFFIAIFTPFHAQIGLVAAGIFLEYVLKAIGVVFIKLFEAIGRNRRRVRTQIIGEPMSEVTGEPPRDISEKQDGDLNISTDNPLPLSWVDERRRKLKIPAINIEHHVDRLGAFVTIVLGEMVANIFFKNSIALGVSKEAGRSFLALMLAFNLNWLYFDSGACKRFVHALRRHWMTGAVFTYIHMPLVMALLLASSAINKLVVSIEVEKGLFFFFGTGVGISILCMSIIGMMHKNLDTRRNVLGLRRFHILATRALVGFALSFIPFAHDHLKTEQILGIYVAATGFLIVEELFMRLEER